MLYQLSYTGLTLGRGVYAALTPATPRGRTEVDLGRRTFPSCVSIQQRWREACGCWSQVGSGTRSRTGDLGIMSPTRFYCAIPQVAEPGFEPGTSRL